MLTAEQRSELSDILTNLTSSSKIIFHATIYCLDNVECSAHISTILCEAVEDRHSSLQKVLARLHLVSDILHNTTIPSQMCYWYSKGDKGLTESILSIYCQPLSNG